MEPQELAISIKMLLEDKDVQKKLKDIQKSIADTADKADKLGDSGKKSGDGIGKGFDDLIKKLPSFGGLFQKIGGAIENTWKSLDTVFKASVIVSVIDQILGIVDRLKVYFDNLTMAGGLVGQIFQKIALFVTGVIQVFKDLSDMLGLTTFEQDKQSKEFLENVAKEKDAIEAYYKRRIELAKAANEQVKEIEATTLRNQVELGYSEISVTKINIEMEFDPEDFDQHWLQAFEAEGSYNQDLPSEFTTPFMANMINKLDTKIEKLLISGATASMSSDLNHLNGLLTMCANDSDVVDVTGSVITVSNVIATINSVLNKMPENIYEETDLVLYLSLPTFRLLCQALLAANLYHYERNEINLGFLYPGTNVFVQPLAGFSGSNSKIVLTHSKNIFVAVDAILYI